MIGYTNTCTTTHAAYTNNKITPVARLTRRPSTQSSTPSVSATIKGPSSNNKMRSYNTSRQNNSGKAIPSAAFILLLLKISSTQATSRSVRDNPYATTVFGKKVPTASTSKPASTSGIVTSPVSPSPNG